MTYEEMKAYNENYLREFLKDGRGLHTKSLEYAISELTKELENRKKNEREKLRRELMGNLQNALSDILHNNFALIIKNTELNPEEDECYAVCFDPQDVYSIEMIDSK